MRWRVWLLGMVWITVETWYFGWNIAPHSDLELIADGIGFLLVGMSML